MSSKNRMTWNTPDSAADVADQLVPIAAEPSNSLDRMARYTDGMATMALGYTNATIETGLANATATITSTGSASNNETASVANQTLTAKTSGAVAANGEFNISGTVGTQATNIAAAINALVALSGVVSATSLAGVVTITATTAGVMGNGLQISESLTNVTATAFAGGSNGTKVVLAS